MNFDLDETQSEIAGLAADLLDRRVSAERLDKIETTDDRFDHDLWAALCDAGLLGVSVPEEYGGLGLGAIELALVVEQLGRSVAPVPLLPTLVAAALLSGHGDDTQRTKWLPAVATGSASFAVALPPSTVGVKAARNTLAGEIVAVPWAHVADRVVVAAGGRAYLLDPTASGVTVTRGVSTAREVTTSLLLDDVAVEPIGGATAATDLLHLARVAFAAVQAGITDAAVRMTASYTSEREQFGKPLSTFQGVALKAADAYLDATAIRAAVLQAAWSLDEPGVDPTLAVLTAAWWAAEAGQRCVHITQHLHGGMGADVTYPVHRYFLAGKQIELSLGGASALLAELGDALADRPDAGDNVVL